MGHKTTDNKKSLAGSNLFKRIFSLENLLALLLALLLIALFITTADSSPLWVYQGF